MSYIKFDGTKKYQCIDSNTQIYEYNLTTAWNISTETYVHNSSVFTGIGYSTGGQNVTRGIYFNSAGNKVYIAWSNITSRVLQVHEHNLLTAWNISTMSANPSNTVAVPNGGAGNDGDYISGIVFNNIGSQFTIVRHHRVTSNNNRFNKLLTYSLLTNWDLSTASLTSTTDIPFLNNKLGTGYYVMPNGEVIVSGDNTLYQLASISSTTADFTRAGTGGEIFLPNPSRMYVSDFGQDVQYTTNYPGDTVAPTIPTGLASSLITNNSFRVTWSASSDNIAVTGYDVTIIGGGASSGTTSNTLYNFTGLSSGTTYAVTVQAYDAANNYSGPSSTLNVTTTAGDTTPPSTVTNLSLLPKPISILLTWTGATDNIGVTGYSVERKFGGDPWTLLPNIGNVTSYDDPVSTTGNYQYRIRAFDAAGNFASYSNIPSTFWDGGFQ